MKKLIPRELFSKIIKWINRKEIFVILGPRQSGKTTLFKMIINFLKKEKKIDPFLIFYFSFEDPELRIQFNQNPKEFIESRIKGIKRKVWIFFDEYHWIREGGQKLKFFYDFYPNIKFFVTGSSSLEITFKTAKYLVGRSFYFYLFPLSFSEFLFYKNSVIFNSYKERRERLEDFLEGKKKKIPLLSSIYDKELSKLFEEYVIFGGYPEVVKERKKELKKMILKSIIVTYLEREIRSLLLIEDLESYRRLLQFLAFQIGEILNFNQLSSDTSLYFKLIKKYLNILEETFILKRISPFFKNITSELRKNPKIYFIDSGLRNAILEDFNSLDFRQDKEKLVENFVFSQLFQKEPFQKINFWRTKAKAEIDFILSKGKDIIPVEVKYQKFKNLVLPKSFSSFIKKYQPKRGLILTNGTYGMIKKGNTKILFFPVWYL